LELKLQAEIEQLQSSLQQENHNAQRLNDEKSEAYEQKIGI